MSSVAISAADVNKLRQQTGAGMMDCKKALIEANGDFEAAVDILRKKGQKVAANRADRSAGEGCVIAAVSADKKFGVVLSLNCETDFVAKNEEFVQLTKDFVKLALDKKSKSKEDFLALDFNGISVNEKLVERTGVIGEKIEIGSFETLEGEFIGHYIHAGNRLATIVAFNKATADDKAKQVAMQVTAMNPISVDEASVPADVVARELEVGKELAIQEGKPAEMAEKIAQGRLNKFYKETTLLNQEFISNPKQTIKQFLAEGDKDLTATAFKRVALS
ncbi:MAG: translation elongation factor Ts [Flavobacteriales bacterium]